MSAFKGRQGKGARQRHRDELYYAAVGRQLLAIDRGWYTAPISPLTGLPLGGKATPAPIEEFLRKGETVDSRDFRSWAGAR